MAPLMNGGKLFRAVEVCCRSGVGGDTDPPSPILGILEEEGTGDATTNLVIWTSSELKPLAIPVSELASIEELPPIGEALPYGSEMVKEGKKLGVLGRHVQLEMVADASNVGGANVALIADAQRDLSELPTGCCRLSAFFARDDVGGKTRHFCHARIDTNLLSVRAATLALAKKGIGVCVKDEKRVDRFLCDRLSRMDTGWPSPKGVQTDRATLVPLRKSEYWLPLHVPGGPGAPAGYTPQALGRRVAAMAMAAADGDVAEASNKLNALPDYACWWARAEMVNVVRQGPRDGAGSDGGVRSEVTDVRAVSEHAKTRLSHATGKINDAQCLQLIRAFVAYRGDPSLTPKEKKVLRLLFRVAQLHGHSPRQLGAFNADSGKYRGYGHNLRTLYVRGEKPGEEKLAPESIARLRRSGRDGAWGEGETEGVEGAEGEGGEGVAGGVGGAGAAGAAGGVSSGAAATPPPWVGVGRKRSARGLPRKGGT